MMRTGGFDSRGAIPRVDSRGSGDEPTGSWRTGPSHTESATSASTATKKPNFSKLLKDLESAPPASTGPAPTGTPAVPSPKKSDPVSSPSKSGSDFMSRAVPKAAAATPTTVEPAKAPPNNLRAAALMDPPAEAARFPEEQPWQKVEPRLERTREVSAPPAAASGEMVSPPVVGKSKKSLDSLTDRKRAVPGETPNAPGVYRPRSQVAAASEETVTEVDKVEKKKKKPNDKKAAIREAALKKSAAKAVVRENELKGSRNDVSIVVDKLEPIFDDDNSATASEILDSVAEAVEKKAIIFESTLILACLIAMCVREVIHHAEGVEEQGLPTDVASGALEELVDTKLLPEARESWKRALPILEEIQKRVSFEGNFNYVFLQEIMRICSQSGCPSRFCPSITLTELMLLALMQTSRSFVTPSLILEWAADLHDETEGRNQALVQTTNMLKWLKGGLLSESGDEASDKDLSDNE
eukprot:Gregarina_sp_Poly_1__568@NODE_1136_length_4979_cov_138_838966_g448_i1_p1_GENE_NODE_1136_length_4979_cov_138_838966_g448_i1NODE_1136_length_4979_cov_138_838966_g448_i1_p1_ORF_typecomplete_len532_score85_24W2/PF02020_18/0_28Malate_DH/PF12434_8/1e03Malate_DH/PF12434_8/0_62_NODE_1136_length_4979_cov_138_838966_g448_i11911597